MLENELRRINIIIHAVAPMRMKNTALESFDVKLHIWAGSKKRRRRNYNPNKKGPGRKFLVVVLLDLGGKEESVRVPILVCI